MVLVILMAVMAAKKNVQTESGSSAGSTANSFKKIDFSGKGSTNF